MQQWTTPILELGEYQGNRLYIKREDLLPFSFGGNKARKAALFFEEIDRGGYDCVLSYGSSSSNHCRIVANACCRRHLPCYLISPAEASAPSCNSRLMRLFGAQITTVAVEQVHDTIESKLAALRADGKRPYFIPGGGHGNLGTQAYVNCYEEIRRWEAENGVHFDSIFHASGTGTTQAGLICGQLLHRDEREIIGISIARKNPRGREIVLESVRAYLGDRLREEAIQKATVFVDAYTSGYGKDDLRVRQTIDSVIKAYGIPLDAIYTGKAFMGMTACLQGIRERNVLFIHTGGTPLFFDYLEKNV